MDSFSPAALIFRLCYPTLPKTRCLLETIFYKIHFRLLSLRTNATKNKNRFLAGLQSKSRNQSLRILFESSSGVQSHWRAIVTRKEPGATIGYIRSVWRPCVVKPRLASHCEIYVTLNHRDPANDLIRLFSVVLNWHVVGEFRDSFIGEKAGQQNICFW